MSVIQRVAKPTTRKGKKVLLAREPQVVEGVKKTLFLQGRKASPKIKKLLTDMYNLKKPDGIRLTRKHDITLFENVTPLEELCRKSDASLFMFGSHNKKRPDNVILGRMFEQSLLDMIELGVEELVGLDEFPGEKITLGTKPSLIFNGVDWTTNEELKHLKSILIDMMHRETVDNIALRGVGVKGLEHAMSFTAHKGKVYIRSYKILLKKSGKKTPRTELEEIGPRITFTLRRSQLPSDDLYKSAHKHPKETPSSNKKNISTDSLGTKHGRIHMKQTTHNIQLRKMKGLRKSYKVVANGNPTPPTTVTAMES